MFDIKCNNCAVIGYITDALLTIEFGLYPLQVFGNNQINPLSVPPVVVPPNGQTVPLVVQAKVHGIAKIGGVIEGPISKMTVIEAAR
jgi:hypothetical protein